MFEDEQKAINGLFDLTQEYAKKHGLSYTLAAGKMANNKFFTGDIYHQASDNEIFYLAQILIKCESIGVAIAAAVLQNQKDFNKCFAIAEKDIKQ